MPSEKTLLLLVDDAIVSLRSTVRQSNPLSARTLVVVVEVMRRVSVDFLKRRRWKFAVEQVEDPRLWDQSLRLFSRTSRRS